MNDEHWKAIVAGLQGAIDRLEAERDDAMRDRCRARVYADFRLGFVHPQSQNHAMREYAEKVYGRDVALRLYPLERSEETSDAT